MDVTHIRPIASILSAEKHVRVPALFDRFQPPKLRYAVCPSMGRDLLGTCPSVDGDYRKAIRNWGRRFLEHERFASNHQNREFIGLNGEGRGWKGSKRSLNIGLGGKGKKKVYSLNRILREG